MENKIKFNPKYSSLFTNNARYKILIGGRGGGRSFAGITYACAKLMQYEYARVYFMRQVYGDIENSLFSDFKDMLDDKGISHLFEVGKTPKTPIENIQTKNQIICKGFKKGDGSREAKLKSISNVTTVIIEEANEIEEDDFNQLDASLRTMKGDIEIVLMLNPPNKNHWIIKRWFNLVESGIDGYYKIEPKQDSNTLVVQCNYEDNIDNLQADTINLYKNVYPKTNIDYYYNMILGLVSDGVQGRIYKNFTKIDRLSDYQDSFFGLDFGYSNDPCALVQVQCISGRLAVRELVYETGLTNQELGKRMRDLGITNDPIYADSAEPKSIDELRVMGFNVIPTVKGADSIEYGIRCVQSMEAFATEDSPNLWKEIENYSRNPKTGKPIDKWNDACDALRYSVYMHIFDAGKIQPLDGIHTKRKEHNFITRYWDGVDPPDKSKMVHRIKETFIDRKGLEEPKKSNLGLDIEKEKFRVKRKGRTNKMVVK